MKFFWAVMLVLVLGLGRGAMADDTTRPVEQTAAEKLGWKLAMHSYTFSRFSIYDAIDKTAALNIKYMSISGSINLLDAGQIKPVPTPTLSDADFAAVQQRMKDKGIATPFLNMGVVQPSADESQSRKLFESLKRMGIDTMVCEPACKSMDDLPKVMDVVEKLAKEYNIKVAIHEHAKPNFYWDPKTVLAAVQGRSPLLGGLRGCRPLKRSGLDPVQCLKILNGRIIAVHFKDLVPDEHGPGGYHDVPWGTGASDAKGMLEELKRQHFHGDICIEYEWHWENSSPEIAKCVQWFNDTCAELVAEDAKK